MNSKWIALVVTSPLWLPIFCITYTINLAILPVCKIFEITKNAKYNRASNLYRTHNMSYADNSWNKKIPLIKAKFSIKQFNLSPIKTLEMFTKDKNALTSIVHIMLSPVTLMVASTAYFLKSNYNDRYENFSFTVLLDNNLCYNLTFTPPATPDDRCIVRNHGKYISNVPLYNISLLCLINYKIHNCESSLILHSYILDAMNPDAATQQCINNVYADYRSLLPSKPRELGAASASNATVLESDCSTYRNNVQTISKMDFTKYNGELSGLRRPNHTRLTQMIEAIYTENMAINQISLMQDVLITAGIDQPRTP